MARRKRLDTTLPPAEPAGPRTPVSRPPIAEVAGQSASGGERALAMAEEAGHLIRALPLALIDPAHLNRDRIGLDAEEMEALMASIEAHGQRTPIEVMEAGGDRPFGLISGLRRLTALERLAERHPDDPRFASVKALVRAPADLPAAYVAMVEENEIRAGISYFERAGAALGAVRAGAFADVDAAVEALFASGSRARRSKIRSFVELHERYGDLFRHPHAIGERAGLRLVEMARAGHAMDVGRLIIAAKAQDAAAEQKAIRSALDKVERARRLEGTPTGPARGQAARRPSPLAPRSGPTRRALTPDVTLVLSPTARGTRIELEGIDLTDHQDALISALRRLVETG